MQKKHIPAWFSDMQNQCKEPVPLADRLKHLKALLDTIENNRDIIKKTISSDFQKPGPEIDFTEIIPVISELRHTIKNLASWARPAKKKRTLVHYNAKASVIMQPKGLVLIISPWNYPFSLCIGPLISALAAGNRVVIKPSEFTPETSAYIKNLLGNLFPENLVRVETGGVETSTNLTSLPFNHIFFTGSPQVGRLVMESAAKNLASVTLELGGKSPCILDEAFSSTVFASRVIWGKFINAGQTCIAPDYLLVPKSRLTEVVNALESELDKRFAPGVIVNQGEYTRIINTKHLKRLSGLLDDALKKGAVLHRGGQTDEDKLFFSPTIISGLGEDMDINREEIFGPLLPIYTYDGFEEAISLINQKPRPLVTYLFSSDRNKRNTVQSRVTSGALVVNDVLSHYIHKYLPFGGCNNSGIGRSHGVYGFRAFSNEMAYLKTGSGPAGAEIIRQPYSSKVKYLIDKAIKYL